MSPSLWRLTGGALVTLAGALLGQSARAALRRRAALLRTLERDLGRLGDELSLLRRPLPEIFAGMREEPFFAELHALWDSEPPEDLWRRAARTLDLSREDRALLASLGAVVGRYDAQRQERELLLVRRRLGDRAAEIERELAGRGRTLTALGAALGALASILMA